MLTYNELMGQFGAPAHTAHVTQNLLTSKPMNGRQICPTSVR